MDRLVADMRRVLQVAADHLADISAAVRKVHEDGGLASGLCEIALDGADD